MLEHFAVSPDENGDADKAFVIRPGYIYYGHVVRLVDAVTGISSPNLILRKIEKEYVQISPDCTNEPVAQLQRIAFQFSSSASSYWAISGNSIIQKSVAVLSHDCHESHDSIAWTITNSEMVEYKYFEVMGPTVEPVTPIPQIKSAHLDGVQEHNAIIEFGGTNLGSHLNVLFGLHQCTIVSVNSGYLRCHVPSLIAVMKSSQNWGVYSTTKTGNYQVPVTLIRTDGVVYPTEVEFQYSCLEAGEIGKVIWKRPIITSPGDDEEIKGELTDSEEEEPEFGEDEELPSMPVGRKRPHEEE